MKDGQNFNALFAGPVHHDERSGGNDKLSRVRDAAGAAQ